MQWGEVFLPEADKEPPSSSSLGSQTQHTLGDATSQEPTCTVSNQLSSVPEMKWYRDKRPLIHLVDRTGWAQHDRPGYEQEAHMPGSEDSQRTVSVINLLYN
ncbi:hypothetical protein SRHO_G00297050 [Serrasalmus rhombeus]